MLEKFKTEEKKASSRNRFESTLDYKGRIN
jgi:hypothetical protein